ncbi:MAG: autotransporter domain-containing protein [Alphaproteobacteria bacterium]|nr:autotransporter domain-containing protein [Alphaproteobacteria bacterium]
MTVFKTAGYFVVSTLLVLSSLLKSSKSNAKAQPSRFSRVISFGDSLSDSGNYEGLTGRLSVKGNLPGRVSNGPVWVENIYSNLPRENYAYIGALSTKTLDSVREASFRANGAVGLGHQWNIHRYHPDFKISSTAARITYISNRCDDLMKPLNEELNKIKNKKKNFKWNSPEYKALVAEEKAINKELGALFETPEMKALNEERMIFENRFLEIKKQNKNKKDIEIASDIIEEELNALPQSYAPRSLDPKALYTVWVGMNDLRHLKDLKKNKIHVSEERGLQTARDVVANVKSFVNNLIVGGAKFIVVASLPTIFKDSKDPVEQDESDRLIKYHNIQLHQELVQIASQNKSVNIIPIDMGAVGDEILNNPASFGLTNVKDYCEKNGKICADPESYLFWDKHGHLTRKGNELLAQYVEEIIGGSYHVVPQMNATEASAKAASKNVNNRLFALRGMNHPLFDSASSLVESHFQQADSPDGSDIASIMMTSDGVGTALPEMKKNRFVRRAQAPNYGASKKNYFPSLSSDASMGKFGIFAAGDLHLGNQRNTEESTGYRHSTKTITIGGDYKFADYFLAGIAMSYIKSDVRLKDHKGSIDINGYAFSLYDSLKWRQFYLDTVFTYGWNQNKIRRNIVSFKRTATGEPLGRHWSVGGLAGYDFKLGNLYFGPTAGLAYGDARIHNYQEGDAGVFNMIVGKQRSSTAVSTLGGHISYKMNTFIGEVTPQIRSSYDHEFIDRSRIVVTELASMPGIPYSIPVQNNDHNYGRIGGGINIRFKNVLSIDLNYETIFARRKARDLFIFGKLRFVF